MAHVGEEGLLLLPGLDRRPQSLGHLVDLLLVIDLLGRVDKGQDQAADIFLTGDRIFLVRGISLASGPASVSDGALDRAGHMAAGLLAVDLSRFFSMGPVGRDADQVGLARDGSAGHLHGLHGVQDLVAELDQVDRGEMIGDIAQ